MDFYFIKVILIAHISLVAAQNSCSRRPPSSTDCSATTGQCNFLFSASNTLVGQLPFPPPNTRSCYRTCHEDGLCKSFGTVVNEQRIRVDSQSADFKIYRIISPNFRNGDYRKSTNCRYSIKCDPGQIISYSVLDFDLEAENTCYGAEECIDWVEISYTNLGTTKRFCASGEVGEVHVDGANEMIFEFASNRRTEKRGFQYFVKCFDPAFDENALNIGAVAPPSNPFSEVSENPDFNFNLCSEPLDMTPRPNFIEVPSAVFDEFPTVSNRYVVGMTETIFYKNGIIQILDRKGNLLNTIRGIFRLEVANRFSTSPQRHFHSSTGLTLSGYGTLDVSGENANFFQLGADPVFQPTPEESKAILELEKVITILLPEDNFDVLDRYDLEAEEPTLAISEVPTIGPVIEKPTFATTGPVIIPSDEYKRSLKGPINAPESATQLADEFGNACNAVLRATACTYQALVLGIDCNTGLSLS